MPERTWVIMRTVHVGRRRETTRHIFGPSHKPPTEAIVFLRQSFDHPESWVSEEADDWDIAADPEIRNRANIDGVAVRMPAHLREALARFKERTVLDDPQERF